MYATRTHQQPARRWLVQSRTEGSATGTIGASTAARLEVGRAIGVGDALTDRVRWAGWALAAAAAIAILCAGYASAASWMPPVAAPGATTYDTVTVVPGDSLWTIATSRYPHDDVRKRIYEIERANDLAGPAIAAGQRLKVPAR